MRFTPSEVNRAMRRLHLQDTADSRSQAMAILQAWDRGIGDVDDVIDAYEAAASILRKEFFHEGNKYRMGR